MGLLDSYKTDTTTGLLDKYKIQPTPTAQAPSGILNTVKDVGLGFLKSAGRSALNLYNTAAQAMPLVGVTGVGGISAPQISTPESLKSANLPQTIGGGLETATELALPMLGEAKTLSKGAFQAAEEIYTRLLKPSTTLSAAERSSLVKTALDEGINMTSGGLQKLDNLMSKFETGLDEAIKAGSADGKTIATKTLAPYIEDAKKILGNTVDVKGSEKAIQTIDDMFSAFKKEYGKNIPLDVAQTLKKNTYRVLQDSYGELSNAAREGQKALARGLKEGIVDVAPVVKGINSNLKKLYQLEPVLERAVNRTKNVNIVSLGGKVLAAGTGAPMKAAALAHEILSSPTIKSLGARALNEAGVVLNKLSVEELQKLAPLFGVDISNLIQGTKNIINPPTKNQ